MFVRIGLIVAIIAGVAAASLNAVKLSHQITRLTADRDREKVLKETTERGLADTNAKLAKTTAELNTTKSERDQAMARADSEARRGTTLAEALKAAQDELDKARNELATWKSASISVTDAGDIVGTLKKVAKERDAYLVTIRRLRAEVARLDPYEGEGFPIPRDLKGNVQVSDPKYGFVLLDIGEDQGVREGVPLLIHRDGKLVAKIRITSTETNRSIANVLPEWRVAEIKEGDQILVQ